MPKFDNPVPDFVVRRRENKDRGDKDTCKCGLPFLAVIEQPEKGLRFYWCSRCDSIRQVN